VKRFDALIVGGGPAGSSSARRLVQAGCRVAVIDRARFPRDKVCAGWITPAVVRALELDLDDYGAARTLQPFTGFRTGRVDGDLLLTDFGHVVSYGIRRCEFDDYLLTRSGAEIAGGQPVRELRRERDDWIINESVRAPVIVGAGGHFCPMANRLNSGGARDRAVVAQEVEYSITPGEGEACQIESERPELFFWPDLLGYGWCVRKGAYLNIGAGHLMAAEFPARARQFARTLNARGVVAGAGTRPWKGHAYLLNQTSTRRVHDTGLLLAGDAAGLALAPSGEGILAAVESGLMAADVILTSAQNYSNDRLAAYAERIEARFGPRGRSSWFGRAPEWLRSIGSRALLGSPWLTRRVLIGDGFLHTRRAAL
jgi:menaquinone-9 beta-reductase